MTDEERPESNEPSSHRTTMRDWLRTRFGTKPIEDNVIYHRVTKTPWYYGDGASLLLLLGVLILTGMFLALTYSPSPMTAYDSVQKITYQNTMGWFVRALHYWSAGMMVIMLMYHVLRHTLLGGYLPPREGMWLLGIGLFFLVITNAFIGYTLRWDERAIYAIRVALSIFYSVPIIGEELVVFIQGGWSVGVDTLSRLYAVHVLFVPFSMLALIAYHVYLSLKYEPITVAERKQPVETAEEQIALRNRVRHSSKGQPFYPYTVGYSSLFSLVVFSIVVSLSLIFGPGTLYPRANYTEVSMPREEWWFAWYSAAAAYLPPWLAPTFYFLFPLIVFAIMVALPFIDHGANRGLRRRPIAAISVTFIVALILGLSALRIQSSWTAWPREDLPPIPPGVELTESALQGRTIFRDAGCFNCHAIGGTGSGFAPNLTGLDRQLSKEQLTALVLQPPPTIAMPSYKDLLSADEIDRVTDFVLVAQTFPKKYERHADD